MADRQTLLLEIAYDGLAFHGVAPQPGLTTVMGELAAELERALGQRPRGLAVAARTDARVSAEQNYVSCWVRGVSQLERRGTQLCTAPGDSTSRAFAVRRAWLVPRKVHARTAALGKHYRYTFEHGIPASELQERARRAPHSWCVAPVLDQGAMNHAAGYLVGTHDFSSFRAPNCGAGSTRKRMESVRVTSAGAQLHIDVVGDAFLRRMVRILVGTLAEVGAGLRRADSMPAIIAGASRRAAGLTAPGHGLRLVEVRLDCSLAPPEAVPLHPFSP